MLVPTEPKLYHIVHVDSLASIVADGWLWCDAEMANHSGQGTSIGMTHIKQRRLRLPLRSHPDLHVGECVPFYFSPRSVMLHRVSLRKSDLAYRGGQGPIVHLEADLHQTVFWADAKGQRWAFTDSNAGSYHFEDYSSLDDLDKIAWDAVRANYWAEVREAKQAEFLVERFFPWELVSRVGVYSSATRDHVVEALEASNHRPGVSVERSWYY